MTAYHRRAILILDNGVASTRDGVGPRELTDVLVLARSARGELVRRGTVRCLIEAPRSEIGVVGRLAEEMRPQVADGYAFRLTSREASHATVSHCLQRWAGVVVKVTTSAADLRTLRDWGRFVGVSSGALRSWCATAGLPAGRSLVFARLLRAVVRRDRHSTPQALLDVVDRRTVAKLMRLAGAEACVLPSDLEAFLTRQRIIHSQLALQEVRKCVAAQALVRP